MSIKDVRLKTIGEIKNAFMAGKEVTVWNYEPGDVVAKIQSANDWADAWLRLFKYDLSTHWFSTKEEVPDYCAFKAVEEIAPFLGQIVTRHTGESLPISLMLTGVEKLSDGGILIHMGSSSYSSGYAVHNFKFTKTGKPVGIEVK